MGGVLGVPQQQVLDGVEDRDLEKGLVEDTYGYIEYSKGFRTSLTFEEGRPLRRLPSAEGEHESYGIPDSTVSEFIDPETNQIALIIELDYGIPSLENENDGTKDFEFNHSLLRVHHVGSISQKYAVIVVYAPPYDSIAFQISNAEIVKLKPVWDSHLRKCTVEVHFRRPSRGGMIRFPSLFPDMEVKQYPVVVAQ